MVNYDKESQLKTLKNIYNKCFIFKILHLFWETGTLKEGTCVKYEYAVHVLPLKNRNLSSHNDKKTKINIFRNLTSF